jgi:AP-3 complex subunit beta
VVLDPSHNTLVLLSRYSLSLARYDTDYDVRDRARMLSSLLRGVVPDITEANESGELSGVVLRREQVRVVLFDGKLAASLHDAKGMPPRLPRAVSKFSLQPSATSWDDNHALLSSLSVVTGREMHGERILPDWLEQGVEPSLRESPDDAPRRAVPTAISLSAPLAVDSARGTPIVLTPANGSPAVGSAKGAWTDLDKFYDDSDDGDDGDDNENEDEEEEAESESEEEEEEEEEGTGSEAVESSDGEEAEEEEQQPRSGTHQSSYA